MAIKKKKTKPKAKKKKSTARTRTRTVTRTREVYVVTRRVHHEPEDSGSLLGDALSLATFGLFDDDE